MNETDTTFSCFWKDIVGDARNVISQRVHRIDHDALCCSRMCTLALESNGRSSCAPGFVTNLTELFAINCVSQLGPESLHIKLFDSTSDLFVRSKRDRQRSVFDLGVLL